MYDLVIVGLCTSQCKVDHFEFRIQEPEFTRMPKNIQTKGAHDAEFSLKLHPLRSLRLCGEFLSPAT